MRGTCTTWKDFVEATPEWGALMVAREEFRELLQLVWIEEDEFILFRFNKHCSLFEKNWDLQHSLPNDTWKTTPFCELSVEDLRGLSVALEKFGQECL